MPPTNISASTAMAVDPGEDVILDLTGLSSPFTTWYVYTLQEDEQIISAWARPNGIAGANNGCRFDVYYGTAPSPTIIDFWGNSDTNKPKMTPMTSTAPDMTPLPTGTQIFFEVYWNTATVPNRELKFTVYEEPRTEATEGYLVISSDSEGFPLAVLGWDGEVKGFIHHANGEGGTILLDGYNAHTNKTTGDLDVYDPTPELITSLSLSKPVGGNTVRVSSDRTSTYYVNYPGVAPYTTDPAIIYVVSKLGVLQDTITFSGYGITRHAPNWDNTILYFMDQAGGVVKQWDLIGNTFLSDLYTLPSNHIFKDDLLVMGDGSILVPISQTVSPFAQNIVHLSAAGSTLNTIFIDNGPFAVGAFLINRMSNGVDDDTFVVWRRDATILNRYQEYNQDGTLIRSVDFAQFDANGNSDTVTATDDMEPYGPFNSCPLMILTTTWFGEEPPEPPDPVPTGTVGNSDPPCCQTAPPGGTSTGPVLPPVEFIYDLVCEGGGQAPDTDPIVNSENWAV